MRRKTPKIQLHVTRVKTFAEVNAEILANPYVHPFRKHFRVAQRLCRYNVGPDGQVRLRRRWTVGREQELLCLSGINASAPPLDLAAALVGDTDRLLNSVEAELRGWPDLAKRFAKTRVNHKFYKKVVVARPVKTGKLRGRSRYIAMIDDASFKPGHRDRPTHGKYCTVTDD
jgi:hypothetical protein